MQWVQGTINKHIVQDADGEYIATFKDTDEAATTVRLHNIVESEIAEFEESILDGSENEPVGIMRLLMNNSTFGKFASAPTAYESEEIDSLLAASNGWTNHLLGVK